MDSGAKDGNTMDSGKYLLLVISAGLIITDHGHFQYNKISLGLALMAGSKVNRGCCPGPELQAARRT